MGRWKEHCLRAATVAALTFLPLAAEAQTATQSVDELVPATAGLAFVIDSAAQPARDTIEEFWFKANTSTAGAITLREASLAGGRFERTADRQILQSRLSRTSATTASRVQQQTEPHKRSWIGRHPVLFGTMVGFGAGFLIGYLPGDDGVFDDFTAEFNGLVLGGAGAAVGAVTGVVVGASTK